MKCVHQRCSVTGCCRIAAVAPPPSPPPVPAETPFSHVTFIAYLCVFALCCHRTRQSNTLYQSCIVCFICITLQQRQQQKDRKTEKDKISGEKKIRAGRKFKYALIFHVFYALSKEEKRHSSVQKMESSNRTKHNQRSRKRRKMNSNELCAPNVSWTQWYAKKSCVCRLRRSRLSAATLWIEKRKKNVKAKIVFFVRSLCVCVSCSRCH